MSDDTISISELEALEQAMTGPRWQARPVDDVAESVPQIVCTRDGCIEAVASIESWNANEDAVGVTALRNSSPDLIAIAKAALAHERARKAFEWFAANEDRPAFDGKRAAMQQAHRELLEALSKVRP